MKDIIEQAFENRGEITPDNAPKEIREAVSEAIELLDSGKARVAERRGVGDWVVNEWLKKAVLLSFRLEITNLCKADLLSTMIKCRQNLQICLQKILIKAVLE